MNILRATATYARGFKLMADPDTFSLRVYVGGFAGPKTADKRADQEIAAFQEAQGYGGHSILARKRRLTPSLRCTGPRAAGSVWFQWASRWRLLPASELCVRTCEKRLDFDIRSGCDSRRWMRGNYEQTNRRR
jgi:hypothetical protein